LFGRDVFLFLLFCDFHTQRPLVTILPSCFFPQFLRSRVYPKIADKISFPPLLFRGQRRETFPNHHPFVAGLEIQSLFSTPPGFPFRSFGSSPSFSLRLSHGCCKVSTFPFSGGYGASELFPVRPPVAAAITFQLHRVPFSPRGWANRSFDSLRALFLPRLEWWVMYPFQMPSTTHVPDWRLSPLAGFPYTLRIYPSSRHRPSPSPTSCTFASLFCPAFPFSIAWGPAQPHCCFSEKILRCAYDFRDSHDCLSPMGDFPQQILPFPLRSIPLFVYAMVFLYEYCPNKSLFFPLDSRFCSSFFFRQESCPSFS